MIENDMEVVQSCCTALWKLVRNVGTRKREMLAYSVGSVEILFQALQNYPMDAIVQEAGLGALYSHGQFGPKDRISKITSLNGTEVAIQALTNHGLSSPSVAENACDLLLSLATHDESCKTRIVSMRILSLLKKISKKYNDIPSSQQLARVLRPSKTCIVC